MKIGATEKKIPIHTIEIEAVVVHVDLKLISFSYLENLNLRSEIQLKIHELEYLKQVGKNRCEYEYAAILRDNLRNLYLKLDCAIN